MDEKNNNSEENNNPEVPQIEVNDSNQSEAENVVEVTSEDADTSNESSDNNVDSVESMESPSIDEPTTEDLDVEIKSPEENVDSTETLEVPSLDTEPLTEEPLSVEDTGPISYPEQPVDSETQTDAPVLVTDPIISDKVVDVEKQKKAPSHILRTIMIIFAVWLVAAAPVASYLWRDRVAYETEQAKNVQINDLNDKIANLESELATEIAKSSGACAEVVPSTSVIENIKASISSGNTQPLEGYMSSGVDVIIAATEGLGETSPTVAVTNITSFIGDTSVTWDFALTDSVLDSYRDGDYKQYFPATAVIGKASNGKVISFSFDCSAKIGTVLIVSSDELL